IGGCNPGMAISKARKQMQIFALHFHTTLLSHALTPREHEVLLLIGEGKTSKEIATLLACSAETVSHHRKSLCRKLRVHSTAELVCQAVIHSRYYPVKGIASR